jgi:hypothetical protein
VVSARRLFASFLPSIGIAIKAAIIHVSILIVLFFVFFIVRQIFGKDTKKYHIIFVVL